GRDDARRPIAGPRRHRRRRSSPLIAAHRHRPRFQSVQMRTVYCNIARSPALGGSHPMFRLILAFILGVATAMPAAAQSTAINGSIEGVVTDESGAVLPGVTVTIANLDTGDNRVVVTSESGLYRAP